MSINAKKITTMLKMHINLNGFGDAKVQILFTSFDLIDGMVVNNKRIVSILKDMESKIFGTLEMAAEWIAETIKYEYPDRRIRARINLEDKDIWTSAECDIL